MRLRDWQSRLAACLAERMARPFAWGSQDCCLFAADCKLAVTGHDPAAAERGTYDSIASAARVVAALGGVRQIGATRFGPEIHPRLAAVGDIGLYRGDHDTLMVCAGQHWLGPGPDGLLSVPVGNIDAAWRVC